METCFTLTTPHPPHTPWSCVDDAGRLETTKPGALVMRPGFTPKCEGISQMANAKLARRTRNLYQLMWHLAHYSSATGGSEGERLIEALDEARWERYPPYALRRQAEEALTMMAAEWTYDGSFREFGPSDILEVTPDVVRECQVRGACPCPHHIEEHCVIVNAVTECEEWIGNACVRWFENAGSKMDTYGVLNYIDRMQRQGYLGGMPEITANFFARRFNAHTFSKPDREFSLSTFGRQMTRTPKADQDRSRRINQRIMRAMGYVD